MAITLPNVKLSNIMWVSAELATESRNAMSYGMCEISFTVQGPEDPNFTIQTSDTYWIPEQAPSYLVAYQRCYEYLKNSMNLSPDQLDQLEQWNQRIVDEVNELCAQAGLPAPDLNANDWSINAPFFNEYATKIGSGQGVFNLNLDENGVVPNQSTSYNSGF